MGRVTKILGGSKREFYLMYFELFKFSLFRTYSLRIYELFYSELIKQFDKCCLCTYLDLNAITNSLIIGFLNISVN